MLKLRRGDSYLWAVNLNDGTNAIDLGNKTLIFTVKTNKTDPDNAALLQVSYTFPVSAESLLGRGEFFIPHTATASLPLAKVWYDFQLSYLDSLSRQIVMTLDAGSVKVDFEVTETVP